MATTSLSLSLSVPISSAASYFRASFFRVLWDSSSLDDRFSPRPAVLNLWEYAKIIFVMAEETREKELK